MINSLALLSKVEPKIVEEALRDENRLKSIQEKLNQFKVDKVKESVPRPKSKVVL